MPRATLRDGSLAPLNYGGNKTCTIITPCGNICLKILPDISDSKGANYTSDNLQGRATPITTYAYSDARQITTDLHFMITKTEDILENLKYLRMLQDLVYPGPPSGVAPYTPPPVVKFKCGSLLDDWRPFSDGPNGVCLILRNYAFRTDPNVAWDKDTFLPYRFTVSCSWEVVYACKNLPFNKCVAGLPFIFQSEGGEG
jgi:hypothetical protein